MLSLPIYVEFGLSEWYSPATPGTGVHPRPVRADDLLQYFPRPTATESESSTGTTKPETSTSTNGSYIDPRWTTTYLVTRKGESVGELYARCEEFLRAFIERVEGQRVFPSPFPSSSSEPAFPANWEISVPGAPSLSLDSTCDPGVGVGHERILLVSHAATIIGLARALSGDEEIEQRMRVGCCTLTTLHRLPPSLSSSSSSPLYPPTVPVAGSSMSVSSLPSPPPQPPQPSSFAAVHGDVIGKGVWTVHGTLADGSFLAGGVERSWGMEDVKTHDGVVVEDPGVPGSEGEGEGEEDGPNGVQVWRRVGGIPSPKM